jgi:preprotein translocase subunit SecG
MSDRPARNPFFPLTAILAAIFVLTVLALVASTFGNDRAPLARLLDSHGTLLIVIEVAAILLVGLLALVVDRSRAPSRLAVHERAERSGASEAAPARVPHTTPTANVDH